MSISSVNQAKIADKESQIEEVSRKIEAIMNDLKGKGQVPSGLSMPVGKKAVRIQEPEHLGVTTPTDPVSDSGYVASPLRASCLDSSEA